MKHVIIGTAGHVDHGKTMLIKALTGIDTDRLIEEKKRGITIELGFAHIEFDDHTQAGIIDVPGHEKFIKNMLAGAGGIDLAMLVVAADEGFMPQTVEHFEILKMLHIRQGIIVFTKADLVDEDWAEMVEEDVSELVEGSFLENADRIRVSAFTGQNIGAGRLDRVEKGTKDGLKLGLSVSVVLVALILFFGRYLMEMFTSTPEVIDTGMHMMRILAIGYVAMAVTQILSGVMRGAGDTMTPMWISLITTVVIRVPIAYGLAALMHSADALFISLLISWVMGAVLTSIAFRMGRWKKKSIINDDVPEPADVQV